MEVGKRLKQIFTTAAAAVPASVMATQAMAQDVGSSFLGIGIASPLIFAGLAALPVIWWLSRNNPPSPRIENFPSMRLLLGFQSDEVKPDTMPVWRKVLRVAAAGAIVAGLAGPLLDPDQPLPGNESESLVILVDNDWAAAENWEQRQTAINQLLDRLEREGRQVILSPTTESDDGSELELIGPIAAADAKRIFGSLQAQPWPADHEATLALLQDADIQNVSSIYWFGNGISDDGTLELSKALQKYGDVTYINSTSEYNPMLLSQPQASSQNLSIDVTRVYSSGAETVLLQAMDDSGYVLGEEEAVFNSGEIVSSAVFSLPEEIRAQVTRVSIEGQRNAGATLLLDDNWRQRPVGLAKSQAEQASALLRDTFYIEAALDDYTNLSTGNIDQILSKPLAVAFIPDDVDLTDSEIERLEDWAESGGMLVRFAGPSMAKESDSLLPVDLMYGNRTLGGTMTWGEPLTIKPFDRESPFYGIDISDDILVTRQVIARPDGQLRERTWASLSDGTPLVTAEQRGEGYVVLFHVSSNARYEWSNLPLRGTFVNMLRRLVDHSSGVTGLNEGFESLSAWQTLDGQGRLGIPSAAAEPITAEKMEAGAIGPHTPAGFYGDATTRVAYNMSDADIPMNELGDIGVNQEAISTEGSNDLSGYLLLAGLLALGADQGLRAFQGNRRKRKPGRKPAPSPAV